MAPREQTPEALPSPAPSATLRPDGLEFHFGPEVGAFDRSLIVRAVEVTSELLSAGAEVRPPSAVFAATTLGRLERAFRDDAVAQAWRAEGMTQRMTQTVAEASFRGIVINTGHVDWQEANATQRLRIVAHEYVHVLQLERAGESVADQTFTSPVDEVPSSGPFWLIEGTAEVVSWLVLQELDLGSYAESLFDYAANAAEEDASLVELESFIGYRLAGSEGLGLAVLSVDYLLRSRSLDAIFDFWGNASTNAPWSASFNRHFGLPPAFYYVAFETYYESTWEGFRP